MNDDNQRWTNYRRANSAFPEVRNAELAQMRAEVNPQPGERILECGTGNGYLTFPLAESVQPNGKIVTYDPIKDNLESVIQRNKQAQLPIELKEQTLDYSFPEEDNSFDKIASIATFHHYDDRSKSTGLEGRKKAMIEFARLLQPEGKLIIADVASGTASETYFNAIDNPLYCYPDGHPHDFLDHKTAEDLCNLAGLSLVKYEIKNTPWRFSDEKQAKDFLHTIHNARCSKEESLALAMKHLPTWREESDILLGWSLFYMVAVK